MAESVTDYAALAQRLRGIASAADFHEDSPIAVTCREAASACDALAERRCETCEHAGHTTRNGSEIICTMVYDRKARTERREPAQLWCALHDVECEATGYGCNAWSPKGGAQ
jgi:hypothetical protein